MTENRWAELRQVGLATLDHQAAVRAATDLLALGPGFGDPLLAAMAPGRLHRPGRPRHLSSRFSPRPRPDHPVARWLGRVGGASGWVSVDSGAVPGRGEPSAPPSTASGSRSRTQAMGHNIIQLHPLDLGVLLELDEFLPRAAWFWDDMDAAAKAAHARRTAKADNIAAVDVAVDATAGGPAAMAAAWAAIIGLAAPGPDRGRRRDRLRQPDHPVRARRGPAGPGSSPSTCTPPTAITGSARPRESCATR